MVSAVVDALMVTMPAAWAKAPKVNDVPLDVMVNVSTLVTLVNKVSTAVSTLTEIRSVPSPPLTTSVLAKLVAKTNVSFPAPPEILSIPEPAVMESAPEPPVMVVPTADKSIVKLPVNADAFTVLTAVSNAVSIVRFWSPVMLIAVAPPPVNCWTRLGEPWLKMPMVSMVLVPPAVALDKVMVDDVPESV